MQSRADVLQKLRSGDTGDILIVGGGINGVGVLRDLAAQGVAATLVDMADFSSGTSAAPSRLIHGGIRYLEQGEFKLVRESVEERDRLLLNAPHQVKPLKVWVPALSWAGGTVQAALRFMRLVKDPGPKGALILKFGLAFFDSFSWQHRSMPKHRLIRRDEALKTMPGLTEETRIVAEYYDAKIESPERLTLELVADAEKDCAGSVGINYMKLAGFADGEAILRDETDNSTIKRRFRLIVNCAGAWIDSVDANLGINEGLVGGTRGSHLVLARPDLAASLGETMLYFETPDHRACLIYALDVDHVLLGTTDLRTDKPDDRDTTDAEIDYLFDVLRSVMPQSNCKREDITFAYAGVRPLPHTSGGASGAISRDHVLKVYEPAGERDAPVLTLIGGKWTTYRACAEQIADAVLTRLKLPRKTKTESIPIGGGVGYPRDEKGLALLETSIAQSSGVSRERVGVLVERYGTTAKIVAAWLKQEGDTPLVHAPLYSRQEIAWIAKNERVVRLEDVVLRRSLMGFEGVADEAAVREVAEVLQQALGWDAAFRDAEIASTVALLHTRHRMPVHAGLPD
ncbi:glycerol-3-phosphate dehydrogenase/oxidase [Tianweitania sp. BSSL-BM11]|uniref:Glycerol-3-phosphate dehydrogenase/oxidase n=1 Tax=Tianweitania aestuarii TaxID=2814886 RepID=A0ABS5RX37_9HYPH|nr:glycerol-3-phosphate dehydrogenase/oxidase [Tianweitania aestuarii]MBS9721586.1 glycerol-3-phosphate dehydrogenase/oxidase [Tianweitania aestuarii]